MARHSPYSAPVPLPCHPGGRCDTDSTSTRQRTKAGHRLLTRGVGSYVALSHAMGLVAGCRVELPSRASDAHAGHARKERQLSWPVKLSEST